MLKTTILVLLINMCTPLVTLAQDTIKFRLNEHNNIVLTGVLNASDTVPLMLHTGVSDVSVIENRCQSVQWDEATNVESWGGSSDAHMSTSNTISVGDMHWEDVNIWECRRSGLDTDGKIGLSLFSGKYVTFDYNKSQLVIHQDAPEELESFTKCPIFSDGDEIFVDLTLEMGGEELIQRFLVHSGYGGCLLLDDAFAEKHQVAEKLEITDQSILKDSYGNEITVNKAVAPKVVWSSFTLNDVPIGFFAGKIAQQQISVLGADFLKRFQFIVDANSNFIYLKPSKYWEEDYSKI